MPSTDALTVVSLGGRPGLYEVTGGSGPHCVTWNKTPTCDCPDFAFRGQQRPCKHIRAVDTFRASDGAAHVYFPMTQEQVLDLIDPTGGQGCPERTPRVLDLEDRAIAVAALKAWGEELRARRRTPTTFDGLWAAACRAVEGLESERSDPGAAAEAFADAAAIVESQAAA